MPTDIESAVTSLCPTCGLCCNGALFADVELKPALGDNPNKLKSLGIPLRRKGRKHCFIQPCPAFQNNLCAIYSDRPSQCRAFECAQVKRLAAGTVTQAAAQHSIRQALKLLKDVLGLLRQSGNHDEDQPLTGRYRDVMSRPLDLSQGDESFDLQGRLMKAMQDLMHALDRDFRTHD
jgi:Fe-S-cluster containining protein